MHSRFAGNEELTIAQLRGYWDAVVSGSPVTPGQTGLDAALAATVEQIHNQDKALSAAPEFASRLLDQLMGETGPVKASPFATGAALSSSNLLVPRASGMKSKHASARAGLSRAWAVISAGSVLLVLLAILAGIFIWNSNREPVPAIIPLYSETTADGVLIRTLLEEHVPVGELTGDASKWIANFKFSLEPGEAWRDRPIPCELSRQYVIGLVESGTLAMINTGPFEVTRSDGTSESIQAGERADLHAGDSWVYFSDRTETNVQKWNPGTEPMVAYQTDWALDDSCENMPSHPEWIWHDSTYGVAFDLTRPLVVTIEQAFVQPGAILSRDDAQRIGFVADESGIFRVIGVESGTLEEVWVADALMQAEVPGIDQDRHFTFTSGQVWTDFEGRPSAGPSSDGMERAFRAGDEEPLVLTSFAWSYDDVGAFSDVSAVSSGMTLESIFEERFPAGSIPENATNMISNSRYILESGEAWTDDPGRCAPVPLLVAGYVESGTLALLTTGSFEVTRADGASETIPAGTEARLNTGDRWVYFADPAEQFTGTRNPGPEPAVIIESVWELAGICQSPLNPNPEWVWGQYQYADDFDSDRPVVMTVERANLPAGAKLSVEEVQRLGLDAGDRDIFRTIAIESGSLEEVWVPDALMQSESFPSELDKERTLGQGEIWIPQTSLTPPEGWVREFRNASDEPMVLAIVAWSYDDEPESG
jgi:hypothetical protein